MILIGCGTAYHSCLVAKYWFEKNTSLDVSVDIASEFRYRKIKFKKDCLYVFVSQSGETADTFAALDLCKKNNVKTCAVVNVVESSIARDADLVLPIHCGPEVGVASTKAFLGQMFLGRGYSYPIALEGALKLKELAYVHAEGYPAGEMKHGPLALIEEGMPVVVIAPRDEHYKKTISNMQEVISRGAKVLLITNKSTDEIYSENIWEQIEVDAISDELIPFLTTIPLQKLAYYSALDKGYDIDKPRNLAKSVTVE